MATKPPARSLWLRWKALRLPWRRKFLVGEDLSGVTFWEHTHNPLSTTRARRTAVYPRETHPGDVLLTPAWIQWLRHTRPVGPTIPEQLAEQQRQASMLQLAAAADRRWAEKPSYLDSPKDTGQAPAEILEPRDRGGYGRVDPRGDKIARQEGLDVQSGTETGPVAETSGMSNIAGSQEEVLGRARGQDVNKGRFKEGVGGASSSEKPNPWKKDHGASSEGWQPAAWTPGNVEKR